MECFDLTRRYVPMLAGAFMVATSAAYAQDAEITTTDLGNGLYMLVGQGGNVGVSVGDDGVFVIDDQFAPMSEKILAAIAELSDGQVEYVLNTHFHGDHTGGNENFANTGATIVAHENVRERMSGPQTMAVFGNVPASPSGALPSMTFSENTTFHKNGHDIKVIHVANAHTDGDAVIHFSDTNVIHAGDVFFNGLFAFIDTVNGGTVDGMIDALEVVIDLADDETQIIPGHGALATRADAMMARDDLITLRDGLGALVAQGLSEDEIVAQQPLSGLELNAAGGFFDADTFVRILIGGLSG